MFFSILSFDKFQIKKPIGKSPVILSNVFAGTTKAFSRVPLKN